MERPRTTSKIEEEWDDMKGMLLSIPASVVGIGIAFAAYEGAGKLGEMSVPKNPDGQFEVVSVGINKTVVKQDGKEYTINTNDIPVEAKEKIVEKNPKLKSFLENGPINIIEEKK